MRNVNEGKTDKRKETNLKSKSRLVGKRKSRGGEEKNKNKDKKPRRVMKNEFETGLNKNQC
jgi:hypothetical protein